LVPRRLGQGLEGMCMNAVRFEYPTCAQLFQAWSLPPPTGWALSEVAGSNAAPARSEGQCSMGRQPMPDGPKAVLAPNAMRPPEGG